MAREISCSSTVWLKFVLPTVWLFMFGVAAVAAWVNYLRGSGTEPHVHWQFLAAWLVGAAYFLWFGRRLRRVTLGDGVLVVSNYFHEIMIPLEAVSLVSQSRGAKAHFITIELDRETPFGRRIEFLPAGRHWPSFSEHPTVTKLRWAADRARERVAAARAPAIGE